MKMKMKAVVLILLLGVSAVVFAFAKIGVNDDPGRYQTIMTLVGQILKEGHYQPKPIDDAFSREVFAKYLKSLDGEKKFSSRQTSTS